MGKRRSRLGISALAAPKIAANTTMVGFLENNPFGILTFIVAPAILTNASSIMALGTSNRFARAIDRARSLLAEMERAKNDSEAHDATAPAVVLGGTAKYSCWCVL